MPSPEPPRPPERSMADAAAQRVAQRRGETSPWSIAMREIGAVDRAMYMAVAKTPTPTLDGPVRKLSNAANHSRLWLAIAVAIAVLGGERERRAALEGVVSIGVTSASVNLLAKSIALRPRPHFEGLERFPTREIEMPRSSSFPSGHAASAYAFSYAVGRHLPGSAIPVGLLAGAVAYSRVHVGVHYPADVAVGATIGTGIASMVATAGARLRARRQRLSATSSAGGH